jgi:mono/diheme cytochrome c family protein
MVMERTSNTAKVVAVLVALSSLGTAACRQASGDQRSRPEQRAIERGRYLVAIMGCGDCHTPLKLGANGPEPDTARLLSGHPEGFSMGPSPDLGAGGWLWAGASSNTAFVGPWGVSYAPNLTPDQESGIGIWTEEMFINAIRDGKKFGSGRALMPPMPWPAYAHATDDDLKAIFAYLRSVRPVVNHVPDWQPPPVS